MAYQGIYNAHSNTLLTDSTDSLLDGGTESSVPTQHSLTRGKSAKGSLDIQQHLVVVLVVVELISVLLWPAGAHVTMGTLHQHLKVRFCF